MDIATFRAELPEFASANAYPDSQISLWLGLAGKRLAVARWGELLDHGTQLFVAHHLVLARRNRDAAAIGAAAGGATAPVAAEGVETLSTTYRPEVSAEGEGGHWNLSTYGLQFLSLARLAGAGGVEIDGGRS